MPTTVQVSRRLLDAISAFRDAYKDDEKFNDVLSSLNGAEENVEKLVPGVKDTTPDAADTPDKEDKAEGPETGKPDPEDRSEGEEQPKNMRQATSRARGYFTAKK